MSRRLKLVDNTTAVLNLGEAPVTAAGKYRCDLWNLDTFLATGNLFVYSKFSYIVVLNSCTIRYGLFSATRVLLRRQRAI
jgi:hypothetical protein